MLLRMWEKVFLWSRGDLDPWYCRELEDIIFICDRADLAAVSCWERPGRAGLGAVGCVASQVGREGWG